MNASLPPLPPFGRNPFVFSGGGGPFVLLSHVSALSSAGNSVTTSPIDTSGSGLIVAVIADFASAAPSTVTDNKGNSWVSLTSSSAASVSRNTIYFTTPISAGTGHTFTSNSTSSFPALFVAAFKNGIASPFDQENGGISSGASVQPGTVTPTNSNQLVVTGVCSDSGTTFSIDSAFTITDQAAIVGGQSFGGGLAFIIQTTAVAVNPTWSLIGSADLASRIATFKSQ